MINEHDLSYEEFESDEREERNECYYGMDECHDPDNRDLESCLGCWVIAPPKVANT